MAPPGRRRCRASSPFMTLSFVTSLLLPLLLFFSGTASAAGSAVLGIDLGTEYLKAVLVKPGIPLEIVLTKDSKRKETAAVAFKPATGGGASSVAAFPERFYGSDAIALAARFPDDVYSNLKVLLGVPLKGETGELEAVVKTYSDRYPALNIESADENRGTVGFRSQRLAAEEGRDAFVVEELLAMQLKQVKTNADSLAGTGSNVEDAVITIPPFYTAEERRSVELAAELAGLNVEALISDGLAVGLNYATSRTFPSVSDGAKPEYHLVYDMGAGSTTASVLRFQSRQVKDIGRFNKTVQELQIMGLGWDRSLGGDSLNQLIVDDMIEKFVEAKKLPAGTTVADFRAHGRTMAKLWKESERLRQILSANSETSTSFEGLFHEDVNFKYKISRATFEKLASEHANRAVVPLTQALEAAKLDMNDIESVILHGGVIRTPFVQKSLESALGGSSKLRTSVNADEAAVFGAAFKGAALSPSFRVKDIRAGDAPGYAVGLKWVSDGKERHQKLFTPVSEVGAEKQLTVKNQEDFEFSFYQQIPKGDELVNAPVLNVQTLNLTASVALLKEKFGCTTANMTTKFSIRLSPLDGLPQVTGGSVSCDIDDSDKKEGIVENVKGFFGLGSEKSDQQPLKDESAAESITLEGDTSSSTTSSVESVTTSSAKESSKAVKEPKKKTEVVPIQLNSSPLGTPPLSATELARIKGRLMAFDTSDKARMKREEALNNLEAFIYRGKDLLSDEDFAKALTKEALAELESKLEEAGEWLYGDGADAQTEGFLEKLKGLKDIVNPALKRKSESSERPAVSQQMEQALKNTESVIRVMADQIKAEEELFSSSTSASASSEAATEPSSSTSASSTTTTDSEAPGDVDNDPYSSSSKSTSTTSSSSSSKPTPTYSRFSPSDLSSITQIYESVSAWYDTQSSLQTKLSETDDPVLTVAEMQTKMKELERPLQRMLSKLAGSAGQEPPKKEKKTKKETKSRKEKEGKSKSKSKTETEKAKETTRPKDEL